MGWRWPPTWPATPPPAARPPPRPPAAAPAGRPPRRAGETRQRPVVGRGGRPDHQRGDVREPRYAHAVSFGVLREGHGENRRRKTSPRPLGKRLVLPLTWQKHRPTPGGPASPALTWPPRRLTCAGWWDSPGSTRQSTRH